MQENTSPASPASIGPLALALALARREAPAIAKKSRNKFHGYDYASGEDVIEACRATLAAHGVSLLCISSRVSAPTEELKAGVSSKDGKISGAAHGVLVGDYWLLHDSGAYLPVHYETPIVPEAGRPCDKATFAAFTEQRAYAYLDALGAKRGEALDVSGREDDGGSGPESPRAQQEPAAPRVQVREPSAPDGMEAARKAIASAPDQRALNGYVEMVRQWPELREVFNRRAEEIRQAARAS